MDLDRRPDFIQTLTQAACTRSFRGRWELIGTAAGDPAARQLTVAGLDVNALARGSEALEVTIAPSYVDERVEALSVSFRDDVGRLLQELEGQDETMPTISRARRAARRALERIRPDPGEPVWSIEDELRRPGNDVQLHVRAQTLGRRPVKEKELTRAQAETLAAREHPLLWPLQFQEIRVPHEVCEAWVARAKELLPWRLALLVVISRNAGYPGARWREALLPVIETTADAHDLIPGVYPLIPGEWTVPRP